MLLPSTPFPVVAEVLAQRPMRTFDFPSVEHFLAADPPPYPFTKTFGASKHEPLVCLHTSGTTGFPKPVFWTHDWLDSVAQGHYAPAPAGYERLDDLMLGPQRRVMTLFPAFHASGVICALFFQLLLGTTVVYPPARLAPNESMDAAVDALEALGEEGRVDVIALPPPHAEYLGSNAALLGRLSERVKTVLYSGGDLSHSAGDAIAAKMQLVNQLASTELGLWTSLHEPRSTGTGSVEAEWSYIHFHPCTHIRFTAVSATLHEATMVKNKGTDTPIQPIFKLLPATTEIPLGDLFTPHPHHAHKWKPAGRADALLNFLTGETFHPSAAEQRISAHAGVAEAVLIGTRRPRAALILRLERGAALDGVWAVVEEVNADAPVYARVARHMVLVVEEPFARTAKGSVQKGGVVGLYEGELDELYARDGGGPVVK